MSADLRTYERGQPYRAAWPARAGGNGGDLNSTRCNVFNYNMAYQAGVAVPTHEIPLRHPVTRGGQPVDRIHDSLRPASLATPFVPRADGTLPPDPEHVRDYFRQVPPAEVRAGDRLVYQNPRGGWSHTDRATGPATQTQTGRLQIPRAGSGSAAGREMYRSTLNTGADGSVRGHDFQRVMVLRPTQVRPAREDGTLNPNPRAHE